MRAHDFGIGIHSERQGEFIHRAAGDCVTYEPPCTQSNLHLAGVMSIFNAAIRVAAATSAFGCPQIERESSILVTMGPTITCIAASSSATARSTPNVTGLRSERLYRIAPWIVRADCGRWPR